jgi:hypothetical protein
MLSKQLIDVREFLANVQVFNLALGTKGSPPDGAGGLAAASAAAAARRTFIASMSAIEYDDAG